jgi:hypothetical protein
MSDTHVSQLSLGQLLIRAIDQGNGASRHEIKRRQIERSSRGDPVGLVDFLIEELTKTRGPGADVAGINLEDDPDEICILARRQKRDGYRGQGMRDQQRAAGYIDLAAANPRVMEELPPQGQAFWKSCEFHYRLWKNETKTGEAR